MDISVVAMVHDAGDRDYGCRVNNFIISLLQQVQQPDEIIIVDTSPGVGIPVRWRPVVSIKRPSPTFNKSHALNIGIRESKSDYVMVTDIDFIFSPNVIQEVASRLDDKTFVLSEAGYLPDTYIQHPLNWQVLTSLATDIEQRKSPGTIQAAHRQFWYDVHGYDEQFNGGLGGMDDDMWIRARKHGLELDWIRFSEAQCLHQWHPVSSLKGKCGHLFTANPSIIKNEEGWGE